MALEIERKFLVDKECLPAIGHGVRIIQGYLSEKPSVRFRIMSGTLHFTVKNYLSGGVRFELETPPQAITPEEQESLLQMAISPPIIKERYKIGYNDLTWEIDVYQDENQGLITADVELPSLDYPLVLPAWAGREITTEARYSNLNLGRHPFSQWKSGN